MFTKESCNDVVCVFGGAGVGVFRRFFVCLFFWFGGNECK